MSSLIDVLIPVYNGERYVRQAIQTIQNQTIRDYRMIVVNDGSTDGTVGILEDMATEDDRIQILHKPNSGIVDALNLGLRHCQAEFIARHDADDNAYPNRFAVQLDYLRANPDCAAVACAVRHIDETGRPTGGVGSPSQPDTSDPKAVPCREPYLLHPFLMVRRAIVERVGEYRHVYHAEDVDLYWRIQEIAKMHNLREILGDYRMHSGGVTSHSIGNGRVAALSAQLSAVSAVRRRSGREDIAFPAEAIQAYKARNDDIGALCDYASESLTPDEAGYVRIATAAKLVEVAAFRPYELEVKDCAFIKTVLLEGMAKLPVANQHSLRKQCSGTVARLAHTGRVAEARALVWPAIMPMAAYRLVLRILIPPSLRRSVKEMFLPLVHTLRRRGAPAIASPTGA